MGLFKKQNKEKSQSKKSKFSENMREFKGKLNDYKELLKEFYNQGFNDGYKAYKENAPFGAKIAVVRGYGDGFSAKKKECKTKNRLKAYNSKNSI